MSHAWPTILMFLKQYIKDKYRVHTYLLRSLMLQDSFLASKVYTRDHIKILLLLKRISEGTWSHHHRYLHDSGMKWYVFVSLGRFSVNNNDIYSF